MDIDLIEKKLSSEEIFNGVIVNLYKDTIKLPNGKESTREVIKTRNAVGIVPVTEDNEIVMVKQFRYPVSKVMLEIPAGKINDGETPEICAKRELSEETGCECDELVFIGAYHPSVAILTEVIYLYVAKGLKYKNAHTDEDEFINTVKIPFKDVINMILNGEITDGKTQTAVLKTYLMNK